MIEVKNYTSKTIPTGVSLGKGYGSFQMMEDWIEKLKDRYILSTKSSLKESGSLIEHMLEKKKQLIENYIIQVDNKGNTRVVRVD